ncbi:adenosine deaminase [Klebsiella aerogenes]|uniref:adenosine deaminase n=1 Tax=Klebsiella aerogenes TaxID=548 RepID=UPI001D01605E|nr:adenosine deaminase [Klebsiella aerogenes]
MLNNVMPDKKHFIQQLPKAEVHVHLEGCFEKHQLARWAAESRSPLPRPEEALFNFNGLSDFLHFLDWASSLVNTRERLAQLSYSYARRLAENGGICADIIFNPTHWKAWHGNLSGMIEAIDAGFREAEQDGLPPVGLCVSLLRQQSASQATELVNFMTSLKHPRIVALSVDGNEAVSGRTGSRFAEAFRMAGKAGLRKTVHAGESSGPEGVSDAILLLGADRIDHGVRAIEDEHVVRLLVDRQIPIGVCPTSNIRLKVYEDYTSHPVNRLMKAGVKVTINTDDPSLLDTSLVEEYYQCQETFGWSKSELHHLARNSLEACFASDDTRRKGFKMLEQWQERHLS